VFLQNPDDLFFSKPIALHALVLVLGQSELQTGLGPKGKVTHNAAAPPVTMGNLGVSTAHYVVSSARLRCQRHRWLSRIEQVHRQCLAGFCPK
jgi:hypothetical protein